MHKLFCESTWFNGLILFTALSINQHYKHLQQEGDHVNACYRRSCSDYTLNTENNLCTWCSLRECWPPFSISHTIRSHKNNTLDSSHTKKNSCCLLFACFCGFIWYCLWGINHAGYSWTHLNTCNSSLGATAQISPPTPHTRNWLSINRN